MAVVQFTIQDLQARLDEALKSNSPQKKAELTHILRGVIDNNPHWWPAVFILGVLAMHENEIGLAIHLFRSCIGLAENVHEVWNNLGTVYRHANMRDEAKAAFEQAMKLKPEDPDIMNNLGTLYINEGDPETGEYWLRKAIERSPAGNQIHWNLSLALLEQEKWEEGFKEYAWGLQTNDRVVKSFGKSIWWDGKAHSDKTLVVYGEQGIGDEIMFASMIPDLKAAFKGKVIFDCHPRLVGLFSRAFPSMPCYPTRKLLHKEPEWVEREAPDYKIAIGNLGKYFRKNETDFPRVAYLSARPDLVKEYEHWLDILSPGKPVIGVSWVGGHKKTRKDLRAVSLDKMLPLFDGLGDVTLLSMQYTEHGRIDAKEFSERTGRKVWHFPEVTEASYWESYRVVEDGVELFRTTYGEKEEAKFWCAQNGKPFDLIEHVPGAAYDYDETAAMVQAIINRGGAIVSVNTSLVHLCGAMGVPCFVLTPSRPAWRYGLTRSDMIFYPADSVRQYRQQGDDWSPAIERLTADLIEYLGGTHIERVAAIGGMK